MHASFAPALRTKASPNLRIGLRLRGPTRRETLAPGRFKRGGPLGVPDQHANVDVNVAEHGGVTADIGRVPRTEVVGCTFPESAGGANQLDERAAGELLARTFYPFAAIGWQDLAVGGGHDPRETGS